VDRLYLPAGRDKLACRKCCGLVYGSQYGKKRRRKRHLLAVRIVSETRKWTPATGWVVSRRVAGRVL
jgi:hypothetical protein